MTTIKEEITGSLERIKDFKYPTSWAMIYITGFKPIKVIDGNIFVTDELNFIDILKEMGISGKRRSTKKQRMIDEN